MLERTGRGARWRVKRLGTLALLIAACGAIAWLSSQSSWRVDLSSAGRNTLSAASQDVLQRMTDGPIHISVTLAPDSPLQQPLRELIERYRAIKSDITLDIKSAPSSVSEAGVITLTEGEVRVEYNNRTRAVRGLSERHLTSSMTALLRGEERWLVFVTGHGERDPLSQANHDWSTFGAQLQAKGFRLQQLNLAALQAIPDNTSALVIASPQVAWLPGEVAVVQDYLARGGNVWWLIEPNSHSLGLTAIAKILGVTLDAGMIVDPNGQRLSVQNPAYAVITQYDVAHGLTQGFNLVSVLPYSTRVKAQADASWRITTLMTTADSAWFETGSLQDDVAFDPIKDSAGPLPLAVALERPARATANPVADMPQRVVVVGDGDFLSNRYVGNGGNAELGLRMANWLARDDALLDMPLHDTADRTLELGTVPLAVIGFGLLLGLPSLLLAFGAWIAWRRRRG